MVHFQLLFKEKDLSGIADWIFAYKIIKRASDTYKMMIHFLGATIISHLLDYYFSFLGNFFSRLMYHYRIYNQFLIWDYQGRDLTSQRLSNSP